MKPEFNRFSHFSQQAAKAEKAGNYKEAAEHWKTAEQSAKKEANRFWCEQRAEICRYFARYPDRAPECRKHG